MAVAEEFLDHKEDHHPAQDQKRRAQRCAWRNSGSERFRNEVDERIAQKRAHRETDEKRGQFANARLVHRDGDEADKRNEAHCNDADKGKNNGRHALLLVKAALIGIDDFHLPYDAP